MFTVAGKPVAQSLDLQSVVTHELGHALGLGHSNNPASVMYPSSSGANASRPHREDETALALIYFGRSLQPSTDALARMPDQPNTSRYHAAHAEVALTQSEALAAPATEHETKPANSVSVLNLKTDKGREVMVYTCEPTLLPPLTAAPAQEQAEARPHRRVRSR